MSAGPSPNDVVFFRAVVFVKPKFRLVEIDPVITDGDTCGLRHCKADLVIDKVKVMPAIVHEILVTILYHRHVSGRRSFPRIIHV